MDIDMSGMHYVMGLGSRLSRPATAVSHSFTDEGVEDFFLNPLLCEKDHKNKKLFFSNTNSFLKSEC